jgi:hypothetical protein
MTPEERRKRMEERLAQMSPEEREQFQARMKERMARGGFGGPDGSVGAKAEGTPGQNAGAGRGPQATTGSKLATSTASTIDSLFGPLPTVESRGRAWLYMNKQLKPVSLRLGISDGTWTEVLNPNELQQGTEVVTAIVTGLESQPAQRQGSSPTNNPLMGPQRGPGGFPGGGRGGGR